MRSAGFRSSVWVLALFCVLVAACKNLIGIEDHRFTGDGGTADGASSCAAYCDAVLQSCDREPFEAFQNGNRDDCIAWCSHLPAGTDPDAGTGNSVSCRTHFAIESSRAEGDTEFCPAAAPGGGSPGASMTCGSNCAAYCHVYAQVCPELKDDRCPELCLGLPDIQSYSATRDFEGGDDTVQCRIAHLTAASHYKADFDATGDKDQDAQRKAHCGHSQLVPNVDMNGLPCDLPVGTAPNCEDYCKLTEVACGANTTRVYDDEAQCLAVCKHGFATPKGVGPTDDQSEDTLECRRWHAYFALTGNASEHCSHAGPGGAGHCGQLCPTYCRMLERGCGERYRTEFADNAACESACGELKATGSPAYNVKDEAVRTDTYQCRLYALSKVFVAIESGDTSGTDFCARAFPQDACRQ